MAHPDFGEWTLEYIHTNYDPANTPVSAEPVVVDRDRDRTYPGDEPVQGLELSDDLTIEVRSNGVDPTPVGSSFDYQIIATTSVRVEASSTFGPGAGVLDSRSAWRQVWQEVKRALEVERINPTNDPQIRDLRVTVSDDLSDQADEYYRRDLSVEWFGYEELP